VISPAPRQTTKSPAAKLADDLAAGDFVVCLGAGDITYWAAGLANGIAKASSA